MFARAGTPKPSPPPFDEQCRRRQLVAGRPPTIIQPKTGLIYRRAEGSNGKLAFMAQAEAGVRKLFWFADENYVGSTAPGETLLWPTGSGDVTVRVVDDAGRAARRSLHIRAAQP